MAPERLKVLLDTDIGTDIDDAVCLAYLLSHPRCDLLGITTVTGEAEKRAMLASALCRHAGREIPIYPGVEHPLAVPLKQKIAQQASRLSGWPHATSFPNDEAVDFLQHTIRSNPGEVFLLTIAPLTNIGLLFRKDPEIPRLLKGLVMMCGKFLEPMVEGYGPLEWNAIGDPHATDIVFRSEASLHRSVGIDVTSRVSMPAAQFRSAFRSVPIMSPVLEWAEVWFRDYPGTTFHDPLAAACLFEPDICRFERGRVSVNCVGSEVLGRTDWRAERTGPHEIAIDVDPAKYFQHFSSIVR